MAWEIYPVSILQSMTAMIKFSSVAFLASLRRRPMSHWVAALVLLMTALAVTSPDSLAAAKSDAIGRTLPPGDSGASVFGVEYEHSFAFSPSRSLQLPVCQDGNATPAVTTFEWVCPSVRFVAQWFWVQLDPESPFLQCRRLPLLR